MIQMYYRGKRLCTSIKARVLASLLVVSFITVSADTSPSATKVGDALPKITLYSLNGSKVTLPDDFKGKVILIHFWVSICPYCIREMQAIEALHNKYGDKDFAPFSINVGESRDAINNYLIDRRVTYFILLDPDKQASKQYWIAGVPMTFIADKSGVLRYRIFGEINEPGLKKILSTLLQR